MSCVWTRNVVVAIVAIVIGYGWCVASEKQEVTVSYVVAPQGPLPQGLKAVAVIDAGVKTRGEVNDRREEKWSRIAADMIEAMLLRGSRLTKSPLAIADRRHTSEILREQDLRLAGLVDAQTAARVGKLLEVQGLIASDLSINIDVQRSTKATIDWGGILGGVAQGLSRDLARSHEPRYQPSPRVARDPRVVRQQRYYFVRPGAPPGPPVVVPVRPVPEPRPVPPPVLGTREVEEVSRHLTVQCSFSLIDASTGQAVLRYAPPAFQKTDKASPDFLFGQFMEAKDLDPVDHFIGELVERAAREFVGLLVPTPVECTYQLVGRHGEGEAAVRAIRADDFEQALGHFQAAYRDNPKEYETVFAMGVTCELMGRWEQALEYYRQAASMHGVDNEELATYLAAKKRLADHTGRILTPDVANRDGPLTQPAQQIGQGHSE